MKLTPDDRLIFINFLESILDDDCGISERSYNKMLDVIGHIDGDRTEFENLRHKVDATDGRFYISSDEDDSDDNDDNDDKSAFNSGDLLNAMCGGNRIPGSGKLG